MNNLREIAEKYSKEKNFGAITDELGSGNKGSTFLTNKNIVIKVTIDREEYATAQDIAGSRVNGKFTPEYYSFKFENPYYIIAMEKVIPISLSYKQQTFLNKFRDALLDGVSEEKNIKVFKNFITNKIVNETYANILFGITDCVYGLHKAGIPNADIHEDNIGTTKNGKIVMFDVINANLVEQKTLIEQLIKLTGKKVILKEVKRVFKTTKMKAYDSQDVLETEIVNKSKDIKIKDSMGESYYINKVELKSGEIGYIWANKQQF